MRIVSSLKHILKSNAAGYLVVKKKISLIHSGKQHSYYVARALLQLGYLEKYYTSSYISSKLIQQLVELSGSDFWSRRYLIGLDGKHVSSNWKYEFNEVLTRYLKRDKTNIQQLIIDRDVAFDKSIAGKIAKMCSDTVWGFQGSCFETICAAKKLGKLSICEVTMAHSPETKRMLQQEIKLNPEWEDSIDFHSFPDLYEHRLFDEPLVADNVFVPSLYLKNSLINSGIDSKKIFIAPLGFDHEHIEYDTKIEDISRRKLKILYVGRISQRKGVKYLLEAIKILGTQDFEMHFIGSIQGSGNAFWKYKNLFNYVGAKSQKELFKLYRSFDVVVFPSLSEGFGLVSLEAMAAGVPVVTTPNSNGPELIDSGVNGFLVPIRSTDAIVNALVEVRNMSEERYIKMRTAARIKAMNFTWDSYRDRIKLLLEQVWRS